GRLVRTRQTEVRVRIEALVDIADLVPVFHTTRVQNVENIRTEGDFLSARDFDVVARRKIDLVGPLGLLRTATRAEFATAEVRRLGVAILERTISDIATRVETDAAERPRRLHRQVGAEDEPVEERVATPGLEPVAAVVRQQAIRA